MDTIRKYTDGLFRGKPKTNSILELKEEIYGNLVEHYNDLRIQGIEEEEALLRVKQSMPSINDLVEDTIVVDGTAYTRECRQSALLATVIVWLLTIPRIILGEVTYTILAFILVGVCGVSYLRSCKKNYETNLEISISGFRRRIRLTWILWGIYFAIRMVMITGLLFGSDIWFARDITFMGPYQFAVKMSEYCNTILTIAYPIVITSYRNSAIRHERRIENV